MDADSVATPILRLSGLDGLDAAVGHEAVTAWHEVTQPVIDAFAAVSGDRNPLHLDPAAARGTPFTGTIAHGAWVLSVIPAWFGELIEIEDVGLRVLVGYDRVRFPAALPVGSQLRMRVTVQRVDRGEGSARLISDLSFDCDQVEGKPVCVARHILAVHA